MVTIIPNHTYKTDGYIIKHNEMYPSVMNDYDYDSTGKRFPNEMIHVFHITDILYQPCEDIILSDDVIDMIIRIIDIIKPESGSMIIRHPSIKSMKRYFINYYFKIYCTKDKLKFDICCNDNNTMIEISIRDYEISNFVKFISFGDRVFNYDR